MSLFPAYSEEGNDNPPAEVPTQEESEEWLSNPSFQAQESKSEKFSDSSRNDSSPKRHLSRREKKKKSKNHAKKKKKEFDRHFEEAHARMVQILSDDSTFYEDRAGSKNNVLIPTLMKSDVPLYNRPTKRFRTKDMPETKKKVQKWRYFNCSSKIFDSDQKVLSHFPAQSNENILPLSTSETQSTSQDIEQYITNATASYNQRLNEDPHDEELWIEYVNFQDEVQQFEKRHRKSKENSIVTEERKLSILSKAILHNPLSETLLFCKFNILSRLHNLDKLSDEIFGALRQDFGNVELWTRYIQITQSTAARCTVPEVLSLYNKALEKVNFMQKYGILVTEIHLLELYTCCALFLRQCGLWEQLCTLIRLNLQLNLPGSEMEDYKVPVSLPENRIQELEDDILSCGLPIYALWLRLEKLRQRVHWYPVSDADCDDPQRVVLPTDVTDFVRPITSSTLTLRLVVITMFLLKVPLIPLRDTVFRSLSLHTITWHMDSSEVLLSLFCSLGITQGNSEKLKDTIVSCMRDLVSYPQYINDELGQLEFIEFIHAMFKCISRNLPLNLETIVLVWWLKFERSLLIAGSQPASRKKRLKSFARDLLKEERHRNNLALFTEYALLERELSGNDSSCVKILETALLMQPLTKSTFHFCQFKNYITQLYRVMVEVYLVSGNREKSIRLLISLALYMPEKDVTICESSTRSALIEYQRVVDEIMTDDFLLDEFELNHVEPQFVVEWIHCQAWFLYLTESVQSADSFLDEILKKLSSRDVNKPITLDVYYRELIYEIKVNVWNFHCNSHKTAFNALNTMLNKGIEEYPNNMCFLGTLLDLETKLNFVSSLWKIEKCLSSNDSQVAKLILILVNRRRLITYESASVAALKLLNLEGPPNIPSGLNNRMKALLQKLTKGEITRQCPLIWTIYLQYCAQFEMETKYKDVYFMAVENCPWVKALYMEAAQVMLDQVSQIQDLMVEKEMRIHITIDEIDILRKS